MDHDGNHGAHVHGVAELMVALEGDVVELQLESPAANIVGFEHEASTPEQLHAVEAARVKLESPRALFAFSGTDCELNQSLVDVAALLPPELRELRGPVESDHPWQGMHSEVRARYRFICAKGSELGAISVDFLGRLFAIEKLHVMWVIDSRQGAAEVTARSRTIELR